MPVGINSPAYRAGRSMDSTLPNRISGHPIMIRSADPSPVFGSPSPYHPWFPGSPGASSFSTSSSLRFGQIHRTHFGTVNVKSTQIRRLDTSHL